jgi:hypothetical protein
MDWIDMIQDGVQWQSSEDNDLLSGSVKGG